MSFINAGKNVGIHLMEFMELLLPHRLVLFREFLLPGPLVELATGLLSKIQLKIQMVCIHKYIHEAHYNYIIRLWGNKRRNFSWWWLCGSCTFPSSEMEKNEDFFSFSGRSVSEGGTLLPRVDFTAPSVARAVMKTRGSKVPPEDTLLSEKEEKSEVFYISDVGWYFLSFYSTLPHCLSVLGCSLTIF